MDPKGSGIETPNSVEQEQPTEIQPEKPAEPPFTEKERLTQQAGNIDETLKDLRPAAQEDKQNLGQTEETFQTEFPEPPVEFTEEPHTVQEVKDLEGQQQDIQRQLENSGSENTNEPPSAEEPTAKPPERQPQPEPEIPEGQRPEKGKVAKQPKAEKRPRLPHEAPVEQVATREQTAELLQQKLAEALDKIYTKIEANDGKIPEDPAIWNDLKEIRKGSIVVDQGAIDTQIERFQQAFADENPGTKEAFKTLGQRTFRDLMSRLALGNPQEIQDSPFRKQQAERDASHQSVSSPDVPVQKPNASPETLDKSRVSNREI